MHTNIYTISSDFGNDRTGGIGLCAIVEHFSADDKGRVGDSTGKDAIPFPL